MVALPRQWRPITGTKGSAYRKKQLIYQLPPYDVYRGIEFPLSGDELGRFEVYHAQIKNTAAGLGSLHKLVST